MALARGPPSDPSPFSPGERGNDGSGGISGSTTPNDAGRDEGRKTGTSENAGPPKRRWPARQRRKTEAEDEGTTEGDRCRPKTTTTQNAAADDSQQSHPPAGDPRPATASAPPNETEPPRQPTPAARPRSTSSRRRQRRVSRLCYTSRVSSQSRTRVKLNRVFFPRRSFQARSLGCGFAR